MHIFVRSDFFNVGGHQSQWLTWQFYPDLKLIQNIANGVIAKDGTKTIKYYYIPLYQYSKFLGVFEDIIEKKLNINEVYIKKIKL